MGQKQSLKVIKDSKNYTGMQRLANHNRGHLYIEVLKVRQIACLILVNDTEREIERVKCSWNISGIKNEKYYKFTSEKIQNATTVKTLLKVLSLLNFLA